MNITVAVKNKWASIKPGQDPIIRDARVHIIVGNREIAHLLTDRFGRAKYSAEADYPGATLLCRVEKEGCHPVERLVIIDSDKIHLDIELEPLSAGLPSPGLFPALRLPSIITEAPSIIIGSLKLLKKTLQRKGKEKEQPDEVTFTVFYPKGITFNDWYTVLAYVHLSSFLDAIMWDCQEKLGDQVSGYGQKQNRATKRIKRGTEILIVPELIGCQFDPPQVCVVWEKDWHRADLRIRAIQESHGLVNQTMKGHIKFYVGPILIGELKISIEVWPSDETTKSEPPRQQATAELFQKVFVSYSHDDSSIVDELEKAYIALGLQYLRDVRLLRSGEKWNTALLRKIEDVDIFQLCWSQKAKASPYVDQEWRHALGLGREMFLRPMYWEKPMPEPPPELADLHFGYFPVAPEKLER